MDINYLKANQNEVLQNLVSTALTAQVINATVYECIKNKENEKALEWAKILNLCFPGELNCIDTMGEAFYNANAMIMANRVSKLLAQKDKTKFPDAIKNWEANQKPK